MPPTIVKIVSCKEQIICDLIHKDPQSYSTYEEPLKRLWLGAYFTLCVK